MILSPSEDEGCVTEKEETQTKESGFTAFRPSGLIYRHIKQLTNAKLIHLAKRMICENTVWAHNEALKIILIQLRSIPPLGHIAEDLMLAFIHLLQRDHKSCLDDKKPYDSAHDDMFHKFLSISGSTSPFLRPLIMTHATRIKASNGNIYEMMHQIKRNCAEWNLEKHYLAQYYKWIVNHAETLTNYDAALSNSYIVELEHILKSYAELKSLPNEALFRLYIEANTTDTLKSKEVLDEFIELYPNVNYLRKYRAMLSDRKPKKEDITMHAYNSAMDKPSMHFAMKRKKSLDTRQLILLLFDKTIVEPNDIVNWERLLYHLLTERPLNEMLIIVDDLFETDLKRAKVLFTEKGTWAHYLRDDENIIKYYLATGKIIHYNNFHEYADMYTEVVRLTKVKLKIKDMDTNHPIWKHFRDAINMV